MATYVVEPILIKETSKGSIHGCGYLNETFHNLQNKILYPPIRGFSNQDLGIRIIWRPLEK